MTPEGWQSARIGDLVKLNPDQLGAATPPDFEMQYLDIASIERTGKIGQFRRVKFCEAPSRARRRIQSGDIVVSTVRPYLRAFALIREARGNLVASTGFAVLRPKDRKDADFIYQHVLSSGFIEFLKPRMTGSNYPAVSADDVAAYPLNLPPPLERWKIAAILSSVDDAIEKTQAVIEQVQVVKKGLMQELLTRGLPGRHTKFKQTEIGEVPEEWEVVDLEELCSHIVDCLHSTPTYTDEGYPAIRTADVVPGRLLLEQAKRVAEATYLHRVARLEPRAGDVLYSREGERFGLAAPVPPGVNLCISQRMMHFRARPGVSPDYLMWLLNSPGVYRQATDDVGGSTSPHVNIGSIKRFRVPRPNLNEQQVIAGVLDSCLRRAVTLEETVRSLTALKSSLMSVLLTGEVRVTPDSEAA